MKEFQLSNGYNLGYLYSDPTPEFVERTELGERFHIRNREFGDINRSFGFLPNKILEYMTNNKEGSIEVLDIGGGPKSKAARQIAQMYPENTKVTNIDVAQINNQQNQEIPNFRFVLEDACNMSIPDSSIDFVYSWQMIEFLSKERRIKLLNQASRVLKPGGVALIDEWTDSGMSFLGEKLDDFSASLSLDVLSRRGNFTKTIEINSQYYNSNEFLMLMKPPVDSKIVSMEEILHK